MAKERWIGRPRCSSFCIGPHSSRFSMAPRQAWSIRLRPQTPPAGVIAYVTTGLVLAGGAIAEEAFRCIRHRRVAGSS
jgi:hypothetical protein